MPILLITDLDKAATHKRLPEVVERDDYGDQVDEYAELETAVPIRIERSETELTDTLGYVGDWVGFLHSSLQNPVRLDDVFQVGPVAYRVVAQEQLTDFNGEIDHYEVRLEEITIG